VNKLASFALLFYLCFSCKNINKSKHLEHFDLQEGLTLELTNAAFNKIKLKRSQALVEQFLYKSKDDYVHGHLSANDKKIRVKARLKGDFVDHLEGNRWSFRILTTDGGTVLNHQRISIHGIHTRAFVNEWVFHQLLSKEGIISLQYDFYPFSVNDTLAGIYALESYCDNHVLTLANRPLGPILKFNENDLWGNSKFKGQPNRDDLLMQEARIKTCNKDWCKIDSNKSIVSQAKQLLNDYRLGKVSYHKIFDVTLWTKYVAINELMGSNHALRWHNLRFYFNPESNKFEPIGFDSGSWMPKRKALYHYQQDTELFHQMMFTDSTYTDKIDGILRRICERSYLSEFFAKNKLKIDSLETMAQQEKENYKFTRNNYYHAQRRILKHLMKRNLKVFDIPLFWSDIQPSL